MATGHGETSSDLAVSGTRESRSGIWAAIGVRSAEVGTVRRLFTAAALVGFALVFFFSGSNALFLDQVGADALPWVYITNAPLVIAAGLGYAAWSRRSATATVLQRSIWVLTVIVVALWLWAWTTEGPEAAFALAVMFRFLFIFGLLGLWEIASAIFDTRQAKRLVPAVALGTMVAFVVGGVIVSGLSAVMPIVHFIAISAVFLVLYAVAFSRAMEEADFTSADAALPATPRQIVSDRFSRNLAAMRSITILLVFVTEFIFYEQVAATFGSDDTIARFLGLFSGVSTLVMVVFTAAFSGRYIARFGLGVGLASMPGGLAICAAALAIYGAVFGIDTGFFVLAVVANLANLVLSNGVETPVGAVMYQPMPTERRMPVRVAVDGWLGSVALLGAGLLLLAFDALDFSSVLPVVWLLLAIGLAGVLLARRLYADYLQSLTEATTVAFGGSSSPTTLIDLRDGGAGLPSGALADDPAAALAFASFAQRFDSHPLKLALPKLAASDKPDVALLALDALADDGAAAHADQILRIARDESRPPPVRARALQVAQLFTPEAADRLALETAAGKNVTRDRFEAMAFAIRVTADPCGTESQTLQQLATSANNADRTFAAQALGSVDPDVPLSPALQAALRTLIADPDHAVRPPAIRAARHRLDAELSTTLVHAGLHPQDRRLAVEALSSGTAETVELLDAMIGDLPSPYVVDLVEHVYATNTRRPPLLHPFLEPSSPSLLRRAGFDAARIADVSLPASINRLLRDDVDFARTLMATWRDCISAAPDTTPALVDVVLADEFEAARGAIWAGLRLIADPGRISEIEQLAAPSNEPLQAKAHQRANGERRANAIEYLETMLPRETRQLVLPVLEPIGIADAAETAGDLPEPQQGSAALDALAANPRLARSTLQVLAHHHTDACHSPNAPNPETTAMAETIERVLALKRVDIFATLPFEILSELAQVATDSHAPAGITVITEGSFGDELFALTDGEVEVSTGGQTRRLAAGTVFGELAVLDPGPRSATVTAHSDCDMLVVARPMLLALTDRRPEVMAEIARVLAIRLRDDQG